MACEEMFVDHISEKELMLKLCKEVNSIEKKVTQLRKEKRT